MLFDVKYNYESRFTCRRNWKKIEKYEGLSFATSEINRQIVREIRGDKSAGRCIERERERER